MPSEKEEIIRKSLKKLRERIPGVEGLEKELIPLSGEEVKIKKKIKR